MRRTALLLTSLLGATLACSGGPEEAAPTPPAPVVQNAPAATASDRPTAPAAIPADYAYYQAGPYDRATLEQMSLWELSIRRNSIFARVGNPFAKSG